MKIFVAALEVLVLLCAGALLIGFSHDWFWAGLGVYMCGQCVRWLAFHPSLGIAREGLCLTPSSLYKGSMLAYVAAGLLVAIGAISTLEPAFAAIVVTASAGWVWLWSFVLRHQWKE